jgi:hypothetical protein
MPAGGGDRDGPLGHLLAADVGEVFVVVRELLEELTQSRWRRFNVELAGEKCDRLRETIDGDHVEVFHNGSFGSVSRRDDEATNFASRCGCHRH